MKTLLLDQEQQFQKLYITKIAEILVCNLRNQLTWVNFIPWVTSYFLHTSYELLFIARVMGYFLHTSYEFLFACYLTLTVDCTSCAFVFAYAFLLLFPEWLFLMFFCFIIIHPFLTWKIRKIITKIKKALARRGVLF